MQFAAEAEESGSELALEAPTLMPSPLLSLALPEQAGAQAESHASDCSCCLRASAAERRVAQLHQALAEQQDLLEAAVVKAAAAGQRAAAAACEAMRGRLAAQRCAQAATANQQRIRELLSQLGASQQEAALARSEAAAAAQGLRESQGNNRLLLSRLEAVQSSAMATEAAYKVAVAKLRKQLTAAGSRESLMLQSRAAAAEERAAAAETRAAATQQLAKAYQERIWVLTAQLEQAWQCAAQAEALRERLAAAEHQHHVTATRHRAEMVQLRDRLLLEHQRVAEAEAALIAEVAQQTVAEQQAATRRGLQHAAGPARAAATAPLAAAGQAAPPTVTAARALVAGTKIYGLEAGAHQHAAGRQRPRTLAQHAGYTWLRCIRHPSFGKVLAGGGALCMAMVVLPAAPCGNCSALRYHQRLQTHWRLGMVPQGPGRWTQSRWRFPAWQLQVHQLALAQKVGDG